MQIKTIKKAIETKLNEWIDTIKDGELKKKLEKNILVSGGSITYMLLGEPVNDYDVYIMDMDVLKELTIYYTKEHSGIKVFDGRQKQDLIDKFCKERGEINFETNCAEKAVAIRTLKEDQIKIYINHSPGGLKVNEKVEKELLNYTPLFFSPNAISLSNDLQIVIRFWGDAKKVHETFDFIHATNYFTFEQGIVTNISALESILTKTLKYQGSQYPVTSIIRAKKFIKRGFNIGAGEYLKIMFQISQLDLNNIDVLEEQLIGIDVAYFGTLIEALRTKQSTDQDFKITPNYINTIIDKIFGE